MDFQPDQLVVLCALAAFLAGLLLATVFARTTKAGEDPRNRQIRQMDADLRLADRRTGELEEELTTLARDHETAVTKAEDLQGNLCERDENVEKLRTDLQGAVKKIDELRQELTERASDHIKDYARLEEIQTELHVVKAGSDAVMNEVARLRQEREQLTDTVRLLREQLIVDVDPDVFDTSG